MNIEEKEIDELFFEAGKLIIEQQQASTGMLQRRFRLGFNRAARIIDQLEVNGVLSKQEGKNPRKILMRLDEFINMCTNKYGNVFNNNENDDRLKIIKSQRNKMNLQELFVQIGFLAIIRRYISEKDILENYNIDERTLKMIIDRLINSNVIEIMNADNIENDIYYVSKYTFNSFLNDYAYFYFPNLNLKVFHTNHKKKNVSNIIYNNDCNDDYHDDCYDSYSDSVDNYNTYGCNENYNRDYNDEYRDDSSQNGLNINADTVATVAGVALGAAISKGIWDQHEKMRKFMKARSKWASMLPKDQEAWKKLHPGENPDDYDWG